MERVLSLSTEPRCRSTISKNCKHHYFSCYLCWTLSSWNPGLTPRCGFPWSGADEGCSCCCIRKDKGLLRFPFLCQSTSPKSKQLCKKKDLFSSTCQNIRLKPSFVNVWWHTLQAKIPSECFDRGVAFRQNHFPDFDLSSLIESIWKCQDFVMLSDSFPGPLAHKQTHRVKKLQKIASAVQFSLLSALAALFWSPLTRVSKATCGQTGDAKSSEN